MKEQLIIRFKNACNDPDYDIIRKSRVKYQFNRNSWVIQDVYGVIKIEMNPCTITGWHTVAYFTAHHLSSGRTGFELSLNEYNELKDMFFGKFKPDNKYLKKIGAI